MAELTGKDKQERLPHGRTFTVWSPESFSPVSQVSAKKTEEEKGKEEGPLIPQMLKPMNMEYSWVCSKADIVFKFMFVLYK